MIMTSVTSEEQHKPMAQCQAAWPMVTALALLSLFLGLEYKGEVVLRPFDALLGLTLLLIFTTSPGFRIPYVRMPFPMKIYILLLFYFAFNSFQQSSVAIGLKEAIQGIEVIFFFYIMCVACVCRSDRRLFDRTVLYGIWCFVFFALVYHVSQGEYVRFKELDEMKYAFGLAVLYSFVRVYERVNWANTLILICALMLMFLSGERKGWAAAAVAIAALLVLNIGRGFLRRALGTGLLCGGAMIVALSFGTGGYVSKQLESVPNFLVNLTDDSVAMNDLVTLSNRTRMVTSQEGWDIFLESPIFGIGGDKTSKIIEQREITVPGKRNHLSHGVHNEFLRYAVEGGVIALCMYCAAWTGLMWQALRYAFLVRRSASHMAWHDLWPAWFSIGLVFYGFAINFLLEGGLLNAFFFLWPAAMLATRVSSFDSRIRSEDTFRSKGVSEHLTRP